MTGLDLGVEEPWELPEGWAWTTVGSVVSLRGEKVSPTDEPTLPFVGMDDIENDGLTIRGSRPFSTMKSAGNRFYQNDVLYGRLRPYLNKTAVVSNDGAASGELLVFQARPGALDVRYLQYFLHSKLFVNASMSTTSGDRPRADFADLAKFGLPLPPLAEQRRIVARIDALFAEIAEGEAALARARAALETFRRALLKAAVTGELTREWREREADRGGAGSELMRIRAERAMASGSRRRGRKGAVTEPIVPTDLPDLPKGWLWASLDDMLLGIEAGLNVSAEGRPPRRDEIGIVKISAVTWGEFDETASKTLPPDFEFDERNEIRVGDFLFSRANTLELVGAPVIVEAIGRRLLLSDKVLRFRLATGCDRWVELVLKSSLGRRQIEALATGAQLSMRNISQDSIRSISIPLPPPDETAEILRRVSDSLAAQDDTLALLDAEAADAARLRQSVLKAAFEGRLVPQDPTDEPARALLERLASSETLSKPKTRGRPRKP